MNMHSDWTRACHGGGEIVKSLTEDLNSKFVTLEDTLSISLAAAAETTPCTRVRILIADGLVRAVSARLVSAATFDGPVPAFEGGDYRGSRDGG